MDLRLKTNLADRWIVTGLIALLGLVFAALVGVQRYKLTPGASAETPARWPIESSLQRSIGTPTLLMFAHPECPCTVASLHQLNRLMASQHRPVEARVVFTEPEGTAWSNSSSVAIAEHIPGVTVIHDADGIEADVFGAGTSGAVVLYDPRGKLIFSGGISAARGHEGDSPGLERLSQLLGAELTPAATAEVAEAPVFGCALHADQAKPDDRIARIAAPAKATAKPGREERAER